MEVMEGRLADTDTVTLADKNALRVRLCESR